jgi:hypothetical protein
MNQMPANEEFSFIDCLTCNEIKEEPDYTAASACVDCGDDLFITTAG